MAVSSRPHYYFIGPPLIFVADSLMLSSANSHIRFAQLQLAEAKQQAEEMKRAQKEALKRQKEESTANSAIHRFVENLKKSEQQEMGARCV